MARFHISKDHTLLLEVELQQASLRLGRGPENDIRLGDLTVSRVHALVTRMPDGRFLIADAESTNGVYLNNHRLEHPAALTDGDVVAIGAYQLRFVDSNELATLRLELARMSSKFFSYPDPPSPAEQQAGIGVLINEANNAVFAITAGKAIIGNEGEVDIRVPGSLGVRASIMQQGAQYYVCSETESPCVKLNGTPVMNAMLAFNDRLEVGTRRFIFREI